jgi:hypothetical protein
MEKLFLDFKRKGNKILKNIFVGEHIDE